MTVAGKGTLVLRTLYWLVTAVWLAGLGALLGALMAVHPPETDRAPLVLLLAGTSLFALSQWLGHPKPVTAFTRTLLLAAVFAIPLVATAGSRASVLTPPIVAGYLLLCAAVAAVVPGAHTLALRMRGRARPVVAVRLTYSVPFALHTLASGMALSATAGLFLWRAHAEKPDFDPIVYPNAYSQSMDRWTWAMMLLSGVLAGLLLRHAWRVTARKQTASTGSAG